MAKTKPIISRKTGHIDYDAIFESGISFYMLLGQRSDGKTYGIIEDSVKQYFIDETPSAYIRRFAESITKPLLQDLCNPQNNLISDLSGGEYNNNEYISRRFYLSDTDGEKRDAKPFLYSYALNTWETAKGADSGKFHNIIFDEYVSASKYLPNEYGIFENVLSSIMRNRGNSRLVLLGNPVNQICPYFDEFDIEPHKLKPGDIVYKKSSNGMILKFVYVPPMNNKFRHSAKFFDFGKSDSIKTGYWEFGEFPHIAADFLKHCEFLFNFAVYYKKQYAICNFYCTDNGVVFCCWTMTDENDDVLQNDETVLYSDVQTFDANVCTAWARDTLTDEYDRCIKSNRQYFADNKTGNFVKSWYTDFVRTSGRFV